ncbi:MAG: hypothetical protein H6Q13_3225 [Bacteroidetes bacterium]|nr:hypothetical protein [Bacteroidota bacterium]
MKAISIKQPWASLIVHGIKDVENRTWKCPKKYIKQRVLVHAGNKPADFWNYPLSGCISDFIRKISKSGTDWRQYPHGAIIGSVEIVDCVINNPSVWAEKSLENKCPECGREITDLKSDYQECPDCRRRLWKHSNYDTPIYNWVLANPILFSTPVSAKGKLSFWEYEGLKEVEIICPECGSVQKALENYTTQPFATYIHTCRECGYIIEESEWNIIPRR